MSTGKCECGAPATGRYYIWNGKNYLQVCDACWRLPETIAIEACVSFAEGKRRLCTLEECVRDELSFREVQWTPEFQAFVEERHAEWYPGEGD